MPRVHKGGALVKVRKLAFVLVVAAGALAVVPLAQAADTTVTVTLAGDLTISAPGTANLGTASAAAGSTKSVVMDPVTVVDGRGSLLGWNVTAVTTTSSMSTTGGATIALSATGPLSWVTGTVTASGSSPITGVSAGAGGFLSTTAIPVATAVLTSGGGTYTYSPTLALVVPANAAAGTYSVIVRQTVV